MIHRERRELLGDRFIFCIDKDVDRKSNVILFHKSTVSRSNGIKADRFTTKVSVGTLPSGCGVTLYRSLLSFSAIFRRNLLQLHDAIEEIAVWKIFFRKTLNYREQICGSTCCRVTIAKIRRIEEKHEIDEICMNFEGELFSVSKLNGTHVECFRFLGTIRRNLRRVKLDLFKKIFVFQLHIMISLKKMISGLN